MPGRTHDMGPQKSAIGKRLVDGGLRVFSIDDFGARGSYAAQLVLDQNVAAREDVEHGRANGTGKRLVETSLAGRLRAVARN